MADRVCASAPRQSVVASQPVGMRPARAARPSPRSAPAYARPVCALLLFASVGSLWAARIPDTTYRKDNQQLNLFRPPVVTGMKLKIVCQERVNQMCLSWPLAVEDVQLAERKLHRTPPHYLCGISDSKTLLDDDTEVLVTSAGNHVTVIICKSRKQLPMKNLNDWSLKYRKGSRYRRQASHRGRFRGQTQSQYLAIDQGNGKDEGKAEAISAADTSKAVVSGRSGMGQAQSQSMYDPSCEECVDRYVPGAENLRRPTGENEASWSSPGAHGGTPRGNGYWNTQRPVGPGGTNYNTQGGRPVGHGDGAGGQEGIPGSNWNTQGSRPGGLGSGPGGQESLPGGGSNWNAQDGRPGGLSGGLGEQAGLPGGGNNWNTQGGRPGGLGAGPGGQGGLPVGTNWNTQGAPPGGQEGVPGGQGGLPGGTNWNTQGAPPGGQGGVPGGQGGLPGGTNWNTQAAPPGAQGGVPGGQGGLPGGSNWNTQGAPPGGQEGVPGGQGGLPGGTNWNTQGAPPGGQGGVPGGQGGLPGGTNWNTQGAPPGGQGGVPGGQGGLPGGTNWNTRGAQPGGLGGVPGGQGGLPGGTNWNTQGAPPGGQGGGPGGQGSLPGGTNWDTPGGPPGGQGGGPGGQGNLPGGTNWNTPGGPPGGQGGGPGGQGSLPGRTNWNTPGGPPGGQGGGPGGQGSLPGGTNSNTHGGLPSIQGGGPGGQGSLPGGTNWNTQGGPPGGQSGGPGGQGGLPVGSNWNTHGGLPGGQGPLEAATNWQTAGGPSEGRPDGINNWNNQIQPPGEQRRPPTGGVNWGSNQGAPFIPPFLGKDWSLITGSLPGVKQGSTYFCCVVGPNPPQYIGTGGDGSGINGNTNPTTFNMGSSFNPNIQGGSGGQRVPPGGGWSTQTGAVNGPGSWSGSQDSAPAGGWNAQTGPSGPGGWSEGQGGPAGVGWNAQGGPSGGAWNAQRGVPGGQVGPQGGMWNGQRGPSNGQNSAPHGSGAQSGPSGWNAQGGPGNLGGPESHGIPGSVWNTQGNTPGVQGGAGWPGSPSGWNAQGGAPGGQGGGSGAQGGPSGGWNAQEAVRGGQGGGSGGQGGPSGGGWNALEATPGGQGGPTGGGWNAQGGATGQRGPTNDRWNAQGGAPGGHGGPSGGGWNAQGTAPVGPGRPPGGAWNAQGDVPGGQGLSGGQGGPLGGGWNGQGGGQGGQAGPSEGGWNAHKGVPGDHGGISSGQGGPSGGGWNSQGGGPGAQGGGPGGQGGGPGGQGGEPGGQGGGPGGQGGGPGGQGGGPGGQGGGSSGQEDGRRRNENTIPVTNGNNGPPQNVIDPNSIAADGDDSQAESSITQNANGTLASASSNGGNDKGRAKTQVSGTYAGSGTFSAQAEISDESKGAQSQVSGGKHGAISTAQGHSRNSKSQANVNLGSETGSLTSGAQSDGVMHSSNTQVQGGVKGGSAEAQARGPGSTSSQAQIGFTPFKDSDRAQHDLFKTPFVGGGKASSHSNGRIGESQSQLEGTFKYGIKYTGAAQSGASLDKDAVFATRLPFNKINVFDKSDVNINVDDTEKPSEVTPLPLPDINDVQNNIANATEKPQDKSENRLGHTHLDHHMTNNDNRAAPTSPPQAGNTRSFQPPYPANNADFDYTSDKEDNPSEDYDADGGFGPEGSDPVDGEYNYDDFGKDTETHQSLHTPSRKSFEVKQSTGGNTQHILLGALNGQDAVITQRNTDQRPDETRIYQPGESVPGTGGYTIPVGFTGSVKSVASKQNTYAIGSRRSPSQAQTVSITPGSGKVKYVHPNPNVSPYGKYVAPKDLRSFSNNNNKDDSNRYVSVSKTVTGALDSENNIRKQYSHTYYTKSSSCGYFTFTCTMVSGSNGRKKVCKPKIPTNPDGTPMRC